MPRNLTTRSCTSSTKLRQSRPQTVFTVCSAGVCYQVEAMSSPRSLSPSNRPPSERQLKMLGYSSPTYNVELRSPSTQSRVRELESQLELLKRQCQLKDEAIRDMMMQHGEKLDESERTWADRWVMLTAIWSCTAQNLCTYTTMHHHSMHGPPGHSMQVQQHAVDVNEDTV